ncbi:MAG: Fpg/Nei family DNA glycosylase [Candidatus Limnocylindrales bacterium]
MPELPEVETIARDLRPLVTGRIIREVRVGWPRIVACPEPAAFAARLVERRIVAVERRAKWLLLDLDDRRVLAIQVMMTGQLFVVPAGAPADRHVHLVLDLDDGRQLRLRDMRKFARVGLYRRDGSGRVVRDPDECSRQAGPEAGRGKGLWPGGEPPGGADGGAAGGQGAATDVFARHGPEPLDPAFTLARFRDRLHARRGHLKPLLLNQSFVAGVGNIYADEALWRARLHPLRTVSGLRPDEEGRLYRALLGVLTEAVERRGSSVDDYTAPGGDGEMQDHLQAYQRTGLPCLRCGRPMRRIVVAQRGTHFCSWCQRLPAADGAGRAALRRSAAPQAGASGRPFRRGRRWTELAVTGALGLTPQEQAQAAAREAARAARTRRAAAARRAVARAAEGD